MRLEIGRFRNRETKPSCGLLISSGTRRDSVLAGYSRNFIGRAWQVKTHARSSDLAHSRERFAIDAIRFVPVRADCFEEAVDHKIVFKRHAQFTCDSAFDHCFFYHA